MTDTGWKDVQEQITTIGPVGFWRWTYRVSIRDVGPYNGPSEFTVSLQRKKGKHWHTVDGLGGLGDGKVTLYSEGEEREGTLNDRTKPSEDERELLNELSELFP